jgi:hypothetical protein
LNDPNVLELYSYILLFRGDPDGTELALPKTLSAKERRNAHLIADKLGLAHYSVGLGSDRQVIIEKRGSVPAPIMRVRMYNILFSFTNITLASEQRLSNKFKTKSKS